MAARSAKLPPDGGRAHPRVLMQTVEDLENELGDLDALAKLSRKKIRDAKKTQEREVAERITNWRDKKGKQTVSRAEVSRHNRKNDAWVIVDGVVYDVTGWIEEHPGGPDLLAKRAGQDVTETFRDLGHSQLASYILSEMYVADLPLIERVQYNEGSDTDADEALSDDEPPMVDFRPKKSFQPGQPPQPPQSEPAAAARPPALLSTIPRQRPNRYRKKVKNPDGTTSFADETDSKGGDAGAEGVGGERLGGAVSTPVSTKKSRVGLPRAVPSTWEFVFQSLRNRATAKALFMDVWKTFKHELLLRQVQVTLVLLAAGLAVLLASIPLPPWLGGHVLPDPGSLGGIGASWEKLHNKVLTKVERNALWDVPPQGHDPQAVLYY